MPFLLLLVAALSVAQAPPPAVRPLYPSTPIRAFLAGGERVIYAFDGSAQHAARVVVKQDGIDISLMLRRKGSDIPAHGLDFTGGPTGEERLYPAISDAPVTWHVFVSPALPRATRGEYEISLEMVPADDRDRAIAAAREKHYEASELAWVGDGPSFEKARDAYAVAAEMALAAGDMAQAAESTFQHARIHDNLGNTPAAHEAQLRALALFRQLERHDREARVLNRLGDLSRKLGEVIDAERYFEQALPLARAADDAVNIADVLNNSGLLMMVLGRFEDAIERLQSAIPLAQEVNSANVEGALLNNIAESYRLLGDYEKSLEFFERAVPVIARLNLPRRSGRTFGMKAVTLFDSGDFAKADQAITQSLTYYQKAGDRTYEADALGLYGRILHAKGETDRAIETFGRARAALRGVRNSVGEAVVLTAWAEVDLERSDADAALEKLTEAVRLTETVANPQGLAAALYGRARAEQRLDRRADAIRSIARAIEIIETTREQLARTELRTSYVARVRRYFDLYIDLLQQTGDAAMAFAMSERSRARTFLEGLAEAAAKIEKGVDPALVRRRRAVQMQVNGKETYRAQLAAQLGDKDARVAAAGRDIDALLEQLTDVEARIRKASPAYWSLQWPEPVTFERVKAMLDTGTALVEYHLGRDRSYAWVIDRHAITAHDVPPAATIDALARRYHDLLSREIASLPAAEREKAASEAAAVGQRLAAAVWKPIEARVRDKRVLMVADGALQYVPFAALPTAAGEPLLARHEIVYLPSASVLDTLRRDSRPVSATASAAVFADPVFSKNDPRFASARDAAAPAQSRAADGGLYGRLRFSRREAEAIAAASPGAFQALDFSAAKSTVTTRDLRKHRILHFATHGTLNTEHPELSGLVFSLVDRNGKSVDGFLRLHEIYNLDLDADLVVLSACRTALGREVHGEGLIGLTRGFMYAGASRVVSSVWNVDDRASALLMSRFYAAMFSKKLSPAAALRDAQLSMLRERRWSNPHYWAAFGLQGEWK